MSILIDDLIGYVTVNQEIDGKWYIAKCYDLQGLAGLKHRIKDAYRVLIGKSRAYHFKEDEGKGND